MTILYWHWDRIRRIADDGSRRAEFMFLLGERYVDARKSLAQSNNAKTVLLPGDLQASLHSLFGGHK